MPLTAIDLFAGAGGFSVAAQKCGIDVRAAVEINAHACTTYRKNLVDRKTKRPELIEGDIRFLNWDDLLLKANLSRDDCDILMGGPPCQGFSTHRIKDAGVDDPRNELLARYFECVAAIRPRAFLVENVPGLLWKRHAAYLDRFYLHARESGYKVFEPVVLNARDFGVPQNRKRVFILGFREDVSVTISWPPLPTHFAPDSTEVTGRRKPAWRAAAEVFERGMRSHDKNGVSMNHGPELVAVFKSTPLNGGSRNDSTRVLDCHKAHSGHKDVYGRIAPGRPGPTMTTACINPSKGRFVHPTANHGITVRHAARFQTFPESFCFYGGLIAAGVQIGNAVPVRHGKYILGLIKEALIRSDRQRLQVETAQSARVDDRRAKFVQTRAVA